MATCTQWTFEMLFKLCLIYMFCLEVFAELLQGQLLSNSRHSIPHCSDPESLHAHSCLSKCRKGKRFPEKEKRAGGRSLRVENVPPCNRRLEN
ncbi:hypothetical protein EXN66_Car016105 [Channa argus]|uniref:Uncharacterized protein n=1 Tax=Channa argus TaxID=215402 RepID=A0A6G1QDU3_CHAAH|nr:hypothetical protein EXN66_Car016105 [Channa argus]